MSQTQTSVRPPIAPMLAKLARELPAGDWSFEPKWDGFRALVSTPLDWAELAAAIDAQDESRLVFLASDVLARLTPARGADE
jgi:ATP-dependent DNA ligase